MWLVDCDLVALLEDDTGMELLVCNKIISLELPVRDVHHKIWSAEHNEVARVTSQLMLYMDLFSSPLVTTWQWPLPFIPFK